MPGNITCEQAETEGVAVSYDFCGSDGTRLAVQLRIGSPKLIDGQNLWACGIEWYGLELPGRCGFGADPLGAIENTLIIVRAIIEMMGDEWEITATSH